MKPKRVTVLLKPEFYALAERLAQESGKNLSELIRALIAEKLREKSIFYDPELLKMPQGERTDLASPEAKAEFRQKISEQLERARAVRSRKKRCTLA